MRVTFFLWGALFIGLAAMIFLVKYKVRGLENELVATQQRVVRDKAAIRVLQAEWTYLNDPERLRRLSAEHLGFGPATAHNIVDIASLPYRGDGVTPAAQPTNPTRLPARPEIEAKNSEPTGFGPVLLARFHRLLLSATAGAATPKAEARP